MILPRSAFYAVQVLRPRGRVATANPVSDGRYP
jgi:hypothetical protein